MCALAVGTALSSQSSSERLSTPSVTAAAAAAADTRELAGERWQVISTRDQHRPPDSAADRQEAGGCARHRSEYALTTSH